MRMDFADLYAMAFSWDAEFEFGTVETILRAKGIGAGSTVIDAGAGTGRFVPCLQQGGFRGYAVEQDDAMCRVLRQTIERHGISDFEAVCCAFEHFTPTQPVDAVVALTDTLSLAGSGRVPRTFIAPGLCRR